MNSRFSREDIVTLRIAFLLFVAPVIVIFTMFELVN